MAITIKKQNGTKIVVPKGMMAQGDFFKCLKCDRVVRILVRGDRCKCSECGGTMVRIKE